MTSRDSLDGGTLTAKENKFVLSLFYAIRDQVLDSLTHQISQICQFWCVKWNDALFNFSPICIIILNIIWLNESSLKDIIHSSFRNKLFLKSDSIISSGVRSAFELVGRYEWMNEPNICVIIWKLIRVQNVTELYDSGCPMIIDHWYTILSSAGVCHQHGERDADVHDEAGGGHGQRWLVPVEVLVLQFWQRAHHRNKVVWCYKPEF